MFSSNLSCVDKKLIGFLVKNNNWTKGGDFMSVLLGIPIYALSVAISVAMNVASARN